MLLIDDDMIKQTLKMRPCIDAVRKAFIEEAKGIAVNLPRMRYKAPKERSPEAWQGNIICGALPSEGVAALRYNSGRIRLSSSEGGPGTYEHLYPDGMSWGMVLLSSLQTGELLAVLHDETLQAMRVGATTGAAVDALAKSGASRVGILGSSIQAETNLEAMSCVRKIEDVKVFSPSAAHRKEYASKMSGKLGVNVLAVDEAKKVFGGADIILCATNALKPVFDGRWLEAGQTLITLATTSSVLSRSEADEVAFTRSDRIVLNSYATAVSNNQRELLDLLESGKLSKDRVVNLGEVLAGTKAGRESDEQIMFYRSNGGVGIQFAATGSLVYKSCREKGAGREIPSEWFGTPMPVKN